MTPLRQKFIEDMQLRGLAAHFQRSPDQLTETDLREYLCFLDAVKSNIAFVSCHRPARFSESFFCLPILKTIVM